MLFIKANQTSNQTINSYTVYTFSSLIHTAFMTEFTLWNTKICAVRWKILFNTCPYSAISVLDEIYNQLNVAPRMFTD